MEMKLGLPKATFWELLSNNPSAGYYDHAYLKSHIFFTENYKNQTFSSFLGFQVSFSNLIIPFISIESWVFGFLILT